MTSVQKIFNSLKVLNLQKVVIMSDILIKKIMDLQVVLLNKHKLPTLFSYNSKFGQVNFGSKTVMSKFGRDFSEEWEDAFEKDLDELLTQTPSKEYYVEEEWGSPLLFNRIELPPWKLPADLDLMIYKELWKWISAEILKGSYHLEKTVGI